MTKTVFKYRQTPSSPNNKPSKDEGDESTAGQVIYGIITILIGVAVGSQHGIFAGIIMAMFWPFILLAKFLGFF